MIVLFGVDVESAGPATKQFAEAMLPIIHDLELPMTWYVTGATLEAYPDLFGQVEDDPLVDLQGHTYAHTLLKTVLIRIPPGETIHGHQNWLYKAGATVDEVEADLVRCQQVFADILGRPATALTGPWGYYRGLADRPDLLEIVHRLGFRALRTYARWVDDTQPVPLDIQPSFYSLQGYPDVLECPIQNFQDEYLWQQWTKPGPEDRYIDNLKAFADEVARRGAVWSICSHDHARDMDSKTQWFAEITTYCRKLGGRFLTISQYYDEMVEQRDA